MRVVVAYDVADDAARDRVRTSLESVLTRVQFSVFEGEVPAGPLRSAVRSALGHIDPATDSLRVYPLCGACAGRIDAYGRRVEVVPPQKNATDVWIDGQWNWDGEDWVWEPGGWEKPVTGAYFTPWQTSRRTNGKLFLAPATWRSQDGRRLSIGPEGCKR